MALDRLPPCVTRLGRAWPALLVIMPENWYSVVGSTTLAGPSLGPKSAGLAEASDMLLGWALVAAWRRELDSIGDEGVLNTCFVAAGGGLSTSSMLRTGCGGGLSTSSILLTGAARADVVLVLRLFGDTGERSVGDGGSSPISNMLRTGERGV
jgi:hypothetical protein